MCIIMTEGILSWGPHFSQWRGLRVRDRWKIKDLTKWTLFGIATSGIA